ncbi:MAG: response regulator [Bacteroidia bacterium]|nr:response regulator [Bacteroidia bacterium]
MPPLKPKHIFIVDDNEIYAMMLDYILSKDSIYNFVSFKSGEECLANLYLNPDVIILDYGLPGINGYETLLEIKKRNPGIHVVILTANKDKKQGEELLKAGADYIVLKQGHGETQIVEKIEAVLRKDEFNMDKSFIKKLSYFFLIVGIVALGFFLFK